MSPHPIGVSPGRVVGPALRMPDPVAEPDPTIRIPEAERPAAIDRLASAAAEIAEHLRSRSTAAGTVGELLEATAAMAADPDLMADANRRILDRGLTPERSVWEAIGSVADTIRAAGPRQQNGFRPLRHPQPDGRLAHGLRDPWRTRPGTLLHLARS